MLNQIILLIILLILSGFFSSAETALFSISKAKARHIAKKKYRSNLLIKKMKDEPHKLLSTILIGNNIVNVGASALATAIAINIFPSNAVGIATGIMTLLLLIFGEIFPKSIATKNNILIAKIVIFPIYWISILFFPLVKFFDLILKLTGKMTKKPALTEAELMTFVEVVEEEGEIKEEEKEMIYNIFDFDDTSASETMTPRADMFVVNIDKKLPVETIVKSGFTRIPVIKGDIDHIVGIINIKDIFLHHLSAIAPIDVEMIMRKAYFVPENIKLDRLLHQFKKRKEHMAIVVDEHGGVSGLITLEDVVEDIFGEISDETDKIEQHIYKVKNKEWVVLGKTSIDEINETIPMNIPDSKEYDTFSGYVLEKIKKIPKENEKTIIGDFVVIVKEMDGNRIKKYIVRQN